VRVPVTKGRTWFVPVRVLVVLGGAMLVAAAVVAVALASTATKQFRAEMAQSGPTTFQLTLRNVSVNNSFGSANVEIPAGFPDPTGFVQVVAGGSKQWKTPDPQTDPRRIELRATNNQNALAPGETLVLTFTASPAPCSADPFVFRTTVKQSNSFSGPPGNDFIDADSGTKIAEPSVVAATGTPTLEFKPDVDSPQAKNEPFSVTVEAKDACGNPGTGTVAVALDAGANTGVLSGTTTATLLGGEATFSTLAIDKSGTDYVLEASWNDVDEDSNEFDVVDEICGPGTCTASDGLGTSVSTVVPAGGSLAIRFSGAGGQLSCGSGPIIGSRITLDPVYPDGTEAQEVVFVWANSLPPGVGVPNYTLCYEDDKGNPAIELPKCSSTVPPTCELHRSRTGVADLRIRILLAPVDPQFDLG
jgi:hypothetical protein